MNHANINSVLFFSSWLQSSCLSTGASALLTLTLINYPVTAVTTKTPIPTPGIRLTAP